MKIHHPAPVTGASGIGTSGIGTSGTASPPSREAKTKTVERAATPELQSTSVRKAMQESHDVDMDKVRNVRQAIANGDLVLDLDALAEAVLEMHQK